jgi:hypothetical protein
MTETELKDAVVNDLKEPNDSEVFNVVKEEAKGWVAPVNPESSVTPKTKYDDKAGAAAATKIQAVVRGRSTCSCGGGKKVPRIVEQSSKKR